MLVNFNGNIIKDSELGFDQLFRAAMFGDGLFESIYFENNQIYLLQEHILRLQRGMERIELSFDKNITLDDWLEHIGRICQEIDKLKCARIRILVWRKGKGTYNPSNENKAHFAIFGEECRPFEVREIKNIGDSQKVAINKNWYSDNKSISALNYVGASIEKSKKELDEVLLKDKNGHIIEASSSNILCVDDNLVLIPKSNSGQVRGVMNDFILGFLESKNIQIQTKDLSSEFILSSSLVIFCNSFIINLLINNKEHKLIPEITGIKSELPKLPLPL